jgi:hypothetical protein
MWVSNNWETFDEMMNSEQRWDLQTKLLILSRAIAVGIFVNDDMMSWYQRKSRGSIWCSKKFGAH